MVANSEGFAWYKVPSSITREPRTGTRSGTDMELIWSDIEVPSSERANPRIRYEMERGSGRVYKSACKGARTLILFQFHLSIDNTTESCLYDQLYNMPKSSHSSRFGPGPGVPLSQKRQRMDGASSQQSPRRVQNLPAAVRSRGAEIKVVDLPKQTNFLYSTSAIYLLNATLEGAAFYNRIGRKVNMKSLHLVGDITKQRIEEPSPGSTTESYARLMILYDRQPNGSFPTPQDILTDYDATGTTSSTAYSGLNMNNRDRFIVLRDTRISLCSPTDADMIASDSTLTTSKRELNYFVPLKDLESVYKASTGAIGDLTTGALYFFFVSDDPSAPPSTYPGWIVEFKARLRYGDL